MHINYVACPSTHDYEWENVLFTSEMYYLNYVIHIGFKKLLNTGQDKV